MSAGISRHVRVDVEAVRQADLQHHLNVRAGPRLVRDDNRRDLGDAGPRARLRSGGSG